MSNKNVAASAPVRRLVGRFFCKLLGHSFRPIDVCIFKIKVNAMNCVDLSPTITCRRCGAVFAPKSSTDCGPPAPTGKGDDRD